MEPNPQNQLENKIEKIKSRYNVKTLEENPLKQRPSWDEIFMRQAIINSRRSSCWFVSSGSIITQKKHIVATGYNGASPKRKYNCLESGCAKENKGFNYEDSLNSGECIGIHSEMNSLGHLNKINSSDLSLYTTVAPCSNCAKNLEPYNIKKVFFKKPYVIKEKHIEEFEKSMSHLFNSGIEIIHFDLSLQRYWDIDIHRNWKKMDIWCEEEKSKAKKIIDNWNNI